MVVTPSAPPKAAPSAAPPPAISSSAWKVRTPNSLRRLSSCRMSEAGVPLFLGSYPITPARRDAAMRPHASAWFPVTWMYSPFSKVAGFTS